jgi:hypothetical protein
MPFGRCGACVGRNLHPTGSIWLQRRPPFGIRVRVVCRTCWAVGSRLAVRLPTTLGLSCRRGRLVPTGPLGLWEPKTIGGYMLRLTS